MLVKKLKCPTCGSNKVTEVKSGYVFCDYCAEFIGFDFVKLEDESKALFNIDYYTEHSKWPDETQQYLTVVQRTGEAIASKNKPDYIANALIQMELQAKLMPGVFSPKMKVEAFRQKFLKYYEAFLNDRLEDNMFEEQEIFNSKIALMSSKMTMEQTDGSYLWKFDEFAIEYFKEVFNYTTLLSEKTLNYPSAHLYPEPISNDSKELFIKQSMSAYCKTLSETDFMKLAKMFGLDNQYIEIPEVITKEISCGCCSSKIIIPEESKMTICETCGNKIDVSTNAISCQNCGSSFTASAGNASKCDYCGSRVQAL